MAERNKKISQEYSDYDVVVIGHGISGLVSGIKAHKSGAKTAILEKSPEDKRGGHSRYAGGTFRFPMEDPEDVKEKLDLDVVPGQYTKQDFFSDLMRLSDGRANPDLCNVMVENNYESVQWLDEHGVDFTTKQKVGGKDEVNPLKTEGRGERLQAVGEGSAVIQELSDKAEDIGVDLFYKTEMVDLDRVGGKIQGVIANTPDGYVRFETEAAILAAGAYVSSPEKRTRYYGRDGHAYKVRGSQYNTGEAQEAALNIGAKSEGQWGGAHQAMIDARAPDVEGGRTRINGYQYGVMLNEEGDRFVDEGEDLLSKTYAKFGREVFDQPGQQGYVIFDSKVKDFVSSQMDTEPLESPTLSGLLERIGVKNNANAVETINEFNEAVDDQIEFDETEMDGKGTEGITPEKSNWAVPIDEPPFYCYPVEPGITFGFGGIKINTEAEAIDTRGEKIPGLWVVGNSSSGFFYGNYPAGSALMRGTTYGRIAGKNAAEYIAK